MFIDSLLPALLPTTSAYAIITESERLSGEGSEVRDQAVSLIFQHARVRT